MLKLPKNILEHPHVGRLEERFAKATAPLCEASPVAVSHWPLDAALTAALKAARGTGRLLQGLELIETTLDREAKGLKIAQAKSAQPTGRRLSRLLFVAQDGSPRFYRDVASLLTRHEDRVWGVLLPATAEELGRLFTNKGGPAKALLIDDKDALGLTLSVLADQLAATAT